MRTSTLQATLDCSKSCIASAVAGITAELALLAISDPDLSAGGDASIIAIEAHVATITAMADMIPSGAQFQADPPTGG